MNYLPPPALKGNESLRWSPSDSSAPDRYYSDAGEEPGRWQGRSARIPATLRSRGSASGLIGLQTAGVTSAPGMGRIRTPRVMLGVRRNHCRHGDSSALNPIDRLGPQRSSCVGCTISAMNLSVDAANGRAGSSVGADRRIPAWAAGLLAGLARDQPRVLTRADIAERLAEAGSDRAVDRTIAELRRLGWLRPIGLHAVWAFVPPGHDTVVDPYLLLRGWRAKDPSVAFRLAGDAAAWHLGYLNRRPTGPVPIWLPKIRRIPDGLRGSVSVVRFPWPAEQADKLGPRRELLRARKLDALT